MQHWPQCFGRAIIDGLPDGAELQDVRYDDCRRCLSVIVHHPSFPPCPDGAEIEIANGFHQVRMAWFVRQPDGSYRTTDDKGEAFNQVVAHTTARQQGKTAAVNALKAAAGPPPYQELPGGSIRIVNTPEWEMRIGPELKAKIEQCTEIVDQPPPASDSREWFAEQMRRTD
jgi:hypothetical protein